MADAKRIVKIWEAIRRRIESFPGQPPEMILPSDIEEPEGYHWEIGNMMARPIRIFIDDDIHQYNGSLNILIKRPIKDAVWDQEQQLGGAIAEHFQSDTGMMFEDVCVSVVDQPEVSEGYREDGWWKTPVTVRWTHTG